MTPRPYLFLDTETGGLERDKHSLLSIGLVVGKGGVVGDSREILIRHEPYVVSAGGMAVNRIDLVEHHKSAVVPASAMKVLESFLDKHFPDPVEPIVLVGHNVAFDRDFLATFCAKHGKELEPRISHRIIDTHSIASALRDAGKLDIANLSSSALFGYFGIHIPEEKRHTALGDALGTFDLYWKLVGVMK